MKKLYTLDEVITILKELANPEIVQIKKNKFGIHTKNSLGIYQKELNSLAKNIGIDNTLALALFNTNIYEAKLLCAKLLDPHILTEEIMDQWVLSFDNWEICDSFCIQLFSKNRYALHQAIDWSRSDKEFVKRAAFVIMANYGISHQDAKNSIFEAFLPIIQRESTDERTYVKKAIKWALSSIGKRNIDLLQQAIQCAKEIQQIDNKTAKWIAANVLTELESKGLKMMDYPRRKYRKKT